MKYGLLAGLLGIALLGLISTGNAAQRLVLIEEFTNYG
jgi:hypothetical protein